ncbi:heme lyase CcmF/NrfE family subunit [Shewanella marisflavi]|uniref:Heme lyase NrfEFG subunit NrfE n=1 Tax=Shewanella marisflavi TaxID=260364 RepID=A0AAC9TX97_9GAMM|nr:heme lyase CcmF/NrfE family subunit [Shewanella marisflavi]ASJ95403.1 heme lyase NrfEFG subunit NrfE [Shewanella marisflavi]
MSKLDPLAEGETMTAEIGLLLLIISLTLNFLTAMSPVMLACRARLTLESYQPLFIKLNALALLASLFMLICLFLNNDFSVSYVANNSNTQLASLYKIAAVWGGHEGSMLFWITAISIWSCVISLKVCNTGPFFHYFYAVLGAIQAGLIAFLLIGSNPFARLLPGIPVEGRDLNPILQDIGLILHPPLLFIGYVGLAVCFAAAIAALLDDSQPLKHHCKQMRPWAILAWTMLTGGNAFGSWWAYNELGWGGWWFWDPVENASFIPWLVATALMHSLILGARRDKFHGTSLFLAILGFSLCLLGTFLVRSGVVQSVHAFAADPLRGGAMLTLFALVSICGFTLLLHQLPRLTREININALSRESLMQLGNLLLLVAAISVLLGTCYPLLYEVITQQSISVGAPYFNSLFIPLTWLISLLMGAAPLMRWQEPTLGLLRQLALLAFVSLLVSLALNYLLLTDFAAHFLFGSFASLWLFGCTGLYLHRRLSVLTATSGNRRSYAMCFAHLGVALSILGATCSSYFQQEELLRMGPGQGKEVAGYTFIYHATETVSHTSYSALQAKIEVRDRLDQHLAYLYPQRQTFNSNAMQISAAGIHRSLFADLYISMGNRLSEEEFLIRISYKPLIGWIWIGALIMMFAGLSLLLPHKARQLSRTHSPQLAAKGV